MSAKKKKGIINITYIYDENGMDIQNLIAVSFALFATKENLINNNDDNGWLLIGGKSCTQKKESLTKPGAQAYLESK